MGSSAGQQPYAVVVNSQDAVGQHLFVQNSHISQI